MIPSISPSSSPSALLSAIPSLRPSSSPSATPSASPSYSPSASPSEIPKCILDYSLNDVCESVAIHADSISFDGEKTRVVGDVGVFPGTAITGDYLIEPGGEVLLRGDAESFAASMWGENGSYEQAYAIRADETYWGAGIHEIGGGTFTPGTYRAGTAINFASGTVTLDGEGDENAVFLFQASSTLVTAANTYFILTGGAKASNIIWALGTAATLGADSVLEGSILAKSAITVGTKSEIRGCVIAKTAVTVASRGYVNVRKHGSPTCPSVGSGSCENFAVHARAAITFAGTANPSIITNGDIGVSPGTSITGALGTSYRFEGSGSIITASSDFATSAMFDHADLRSRRSDEIYWGVGIHEIGKIGGETYKPGTYHAGTAINFAYGTTVTLDGDGDENAVFLFQAGTTFVTAADTSFNLINGAKAENIIWALGTGATLGARSVVEGSIFAGTAITMGINSQINGCAIAMTAITFETEGFVTLVPLSY
jgi:hypothetical protein